MRPEVIPAYAIIDYTWDVLKANTTMTTANYSGRIPIIPTSQQPEFTDTNKPFIVYGFSENPTDIDIPSFRTGQVAYAIYGSTDREITTILNVLATIFGRFDKTAEDINKWAVGKPFEGLRFTSLSVGIIEGPTPETQEGGRQSAVLMIRFGYIPDYVIKGVDGNPINFAS